VARDFCDGAGIELIVWLCDCQYDHVTCVISSSVLCKSCGEIFFSMRKEEDWYC
jgi:hypothetical protein